MKKLLSIAAGSIFLCVLVSCSKPNVEVVDTKGMPIEGAEVQVITHSINGPSKLTNKDGKVAVSSGGAQATKWISVTKAGYIDSGHIDFEQPKPIKVVLTPK